MIETRELEALTDAVSEVVNAHIADIVTTLRAEIKETVQRHIQGLPPGPPGKDAAPVDLDSIAQRAASLIKQPRDGKDADPEFIRAEVQAAVAALPAAKDGKDGIDGKDGLNGADGLPGSNGRDGERGTDGKDAPPVDMDSIVLRAAELIPKPLDGKDGASGPAGPPGPQGERGLDGESIKGAPGEPGLPGRDGADGRSVELEEVQEIAERLVEQRASQWELDFERRAQEQFQRAIDRMPKPIDGRDGFQLEDVTFSDDGHGVVTLLFKRGEFERTHTFRIPCFEDMGVFQAGSAYLRGHGVTFGGNFWLAQRDNPEGKPAEGPDWRLAVRKGRDGKDGALKEPKPEGPVKL